jgi:hypothetical protein
VAGYRDRLEAGRRQPPHISGKAGVVQTPELSIAADLSKSHKLHEITLISINCSWG